MNVDVEVEGDVGGLSEQVRTALFRVAQEALTNCLKHAGAADAKVLLQQAPAQLVLSVQDNGRGFTAGSTSGIGLLRMRERIEELGRAFAIIASPGGGTLIRATLPKTALE